MSDNHTVQPIKDGDTTEIIRTLNHNFQVITERIKELNIGISYLDLLKINQVFIVEPDSASDQEANLQHFVSSCWNILPNYAGVYIQCTTNDVTLFKWMDKYDVSSGDFIIKLPNNQSLYLPGQKPKTMVPESWSNGVITYTLATNASTSTSVSLGFTSTVSAYMGYSTTYVAGATIPALNSTTMASYTCMRYYTRKGEEVMLGNETKSVIASIDIIGIGYTH